MDQAARWYEKAAEQGYLDAQYNLAIMYDNGFGVSKDRGKAVKWYRKAAEQERIKHNILWLQGICMA